jgi:hypothetical protein
MQLIRRRSEKIQRRVHKSDIEAKVENKQHNRQRFIQEMSPLNSLI